MSLLARARAQDVLSLALAFEKKMEKFAERASAIVMLGLGEKCAERAITALGDGFLQKLVLFKWTNFLGRFRFD